jgi:hypothetical protein
MFAKDQEINHDAVNKKLFEIVAARGKKGTDRSQMIELLQVGCRRQISNVLKTACVSVYETT